MGLQDQLVYMRGLEYYIGWYGDAHISGAAAMLTGTATATQQSNGTYANITAAAQSIDQYLATKIGAGMPWPSLLLGYASCSYDANANGVWGFGNDPVAAYAKIFANLTTTGPSPEMLRRLARRKSVLDAVSSDVNAFVKRLPVEDRLRADAQLGTIQAMEAQIALAQKASACAPPTMAPSMDYTDPVNLPTAIRGLTDIAVSALACNLTRVVVLAQSSQYWAPQCAYAPVSQPDSGYHSLSHGVHDGSAQCSAPNLPGAQGLWVTERQFLHQLVAELAQKLQNIPESGGTMLDHTIILVPSENGVYNGHNFNDLCWTSVGGKGLGVKTGQCMQLGTNCSESGGGVPVQRLFVSILNALGIPDQTFNDDPKGGTGTGPLPGYLA
jgi:hypothetical protein